MIPFYECKDRKHYITHDGSLYNVSQLVSCLPCNGDRNKSVFWNATRHYYVPNVKQIGL